MSFKSTGKAAANESKYPFIVEVPVAANGLDVALNRQIVGFHRSRRIPPDLDAPFGEMSNTIIVGASRIWRRRAPLSNSLAERSTK